ncbi:NCS1 family nucleobase:cation symporter-1 [Sulfurisphaera tokodaii]|uniref:NCS1 family transporter n=2 Tax=Sulfurisphaera tokodaii TaxID=111955 RepID=Q972L5_SULTO|nr:cytosine permease [Sulfurisphaera tokodaii]BAB66150.1 NCS1 family transporter [Sulfurisphaera tokodaii str. 7]HII74648.1 transporter [Sulfurisphaera tokodaii]
MTEKVIDRVSITKYYPETGQVELTETFPNEKFLWNADIHPTPVKNRNWGAFTFFMIWVSMVFIIPSWTLASVGLVFGLNIIQSISLVFLGNAIVLIPMIIQSHGGARYGLAEPQLTRSRWGVYGAMFPSWLRAVIGAGWWGIESYIITEAATAIYAILSGKLSVVAYTVSHYADYPFVLSKDFPGVFWATFVIVILLQILVFYFSPIKKSQPLLKWLARIGGLVVLIAFIVVWTTFMSRVGWSVNIFTLSSSTSSASILTILAFLNANIAYWATMAITMPDYVRFAKSQFSQIAGQAPMPLLMLIVAVMGSMTTAAALKLYGIPIWDPIVLVTLHMSSPANILILLSFILATFLVNAFANAIGPAYDIANTFPKYLSWFRGSLIVVAISLALGAWTYYGNAYSYIDSWLLTYGGLLGSIEGVIMFDYAIVRRFKFDLADIFLSKGRFRYWKGINPAAVIAFIIVAAILYLPYPGESIALDNSWLLSFLLSGAIYLPLMKYWIIPKYQPELKGSLLHGYYSEDTLKIFKMIKAE